jgi:hypothetical protein
MFDHQHALCKPAGTAGLAFRLRYRAKAWRVLTSGAHIQADTFPRSNA